MLQQSPETPEARRRHPGAHPHRRGIWGHLGPGSRGFEIVRRVAVGVYSDGFLHAGNLAYLTLLWTVSSFIGTIRDILRRAYGTGYDRPFWHYRLLGIAIAFIAVALILFALAAQIVVTAIEQVVIRFVPAAQHLLDFEAGWVWATIAVFGGLFALFWTLAPSAYRSAAFPKWPGALATTLWWGGALALLPPALALFGGYALTYGSLAGVIVALLFFWIVGFGLVIGAHLNAALANPAPREPRHTNNILEEGNG